MEGASAGVDYSPSLRFWQAWLGVALAMIAMVAGCQSEPLVVNDNAELAPITTAELASRLGMEVASRSGHSTTLRNPSNIVVIYGEPGGQAYVNGHKVAMEGRISSRDGDMIVPPGLEEAIRPMLRTPAPPQVTVNRPVINAPRPDRVSRATVIVVDPGHGGDDPGAISVRGTREDAITLAVGLMVAHELECRGHHVIMTRRGRQTIELEDRAAVANRARADLFVSIHADSAPNRAAQGFTVYVSRSASPVSRSVAENIRRQMAATGAADRGVREADFRVLVKTQCPAVLVELGYLSNAYEAGRLIDPSYQQRLAESIVRGCDAWLAGKTR